MWRRLFCTCRARSVAKHFRKLRKIFLFLNLVKRSQFFSQAAQENPTKPNTRTRARTCVDIC